MKLSSLQSQAVLFGERLGAMLKSGNLHQKPGSAPGIEYSADVTHAPQAGTLKIDLTCFNDDRLETYSFDSTQAYLDFSLPEWAHWHWINIVGLDAHCIHALSQRHHIHLLAAEDIFNVPQRAKVESYDEGLFIVQRMLMITEHNLKEEQVSFWHHANMLFTFQEHPGDLWDPVRKRIEMPHGRMRKLGTPYLLYALIDALVDQFFPILEHYEEPLESLEQDILKRPTREQQLSIHAIRRELACLKRILWPLRECLDELCRNDDLSLPDEVQAFFRDVYDHALQANDLLETCRDMTAGLNDLYMNTVSARLNEVMKVLTVMASLFIPITFLAGVYGMNFEHIPELSWPHAYPVFWGVCLIVVTTLLVLFRKRGWL